MPHHVVPIGAVTVAIRAGYVSRSQRRRFGLVGTTGGSTHPPGLIGDPAGPARGVGASRAVHGDAHPRRGSLVGHQVVLAWTTG